MASCCSVPIASTPEEVLGLVGESSEDSHRCGQPASCASKIDLRKRSWPTASAVERDRPEVAAGKLLFTQYIMADTALPVLITEDTVQSGPASLVGRDRS